MGSGKVYVMDEYDLDELEKALNEATTVEDLKRVIALLLWKLPIS